jgi:hypothetical protein
VKGSQAQTESRKEMLINLRSALELKIARKTALETKLRNLSAEIEADEKKIAELPGLTALHHVQYSERLSRTDEEH